MLITSPQNPKIKQVVALRDRRERERSGLMRVEGYDELALALDSGARPAALFFCPALFRAPDQVDLLDRARGAGAVAIEVSEPVFRKIAYREGPDGWLATCPAPRRGLAGLHLGASPFLVVVEALEKPGNLGAILRTADAAGVEALVAADPVTDWGNPNVVRASKGAVFSVPVAAAGTPETIGWLRERGIAIVAATPRGDRAYTRADLRGPVALAVGAEQHGLSPTWLAAADLAVRIPMAGRVNSLNVATATALLIYEVVRQRAAAAAQIRTKSAAFRLAPPTSAPSISGWPANSAILAPVTLPPYCTRTRAAPAASKRAASVARISAATRPASAPSAARPLPIAQTGS